MLYDFLYFVIASSSIQIERWLNSGVILKVLPVGYKAILEKQNTRSDIIYMNFIFWMKKCKINRYQIDFNKCELQYKQKYKTI